MYRLNHLFLVLLYPKYKCLLDFFKTIFILTVSISTYETGIWE